MLQFWGMISKWFISFLKRVLIQILFQKYVFIFWMSLFFFMLEAGGERGIDLFCCFRMKCLHGMLLVVKGILRLSKVFWKEKIFRLINKEKRFFSFFLFSLVWDFFDDLLKSTFVKQKGKDSFVWGNWGRSFWHCYFIGGKRCFNLF